jgi:hypothetical protein
VVPYGNTRIDELIKIARTYPGSMELKIIIPQNYHSAHCHRGNPRFLKRSAPPGETGVGKAGYNRRCLVAGKNGFDCFFLRAV